MPAEGSLPARQGALASLSPAEEMFRQLAEHISGVVWFSDRADNSIVYASSAFEKLWGQNLESLYALPRSWLDLIHPDDKDRVLAAAHREETTGEYDEEYRIVRPDGSVRWIHDRKFPIREPLGRVFTIAGIAEDITNRKGPAGDGRDQPPEKLEAGPPMTNGSLLPASES